MIRIILCLLLLALPCYALTYTETYNFVKPEAGDRGWHTLFSEDMDSIDSAILQAVQSQDVFITFTGDSGTTTADSATDTFTITGGTNITTAIAGDVVTITSTAGGSQNTWTVISGDSGAVTADIVGDSLTIAGAGISSTTAAADTITITSTEVDGDVNNETQNIWSTITGDSGSTAADLSGDSFTITGGTSITTSITGDAVTMNVDDDFLKLGGDIASAGTYDFGSANVVLEIPNAAAPTTNATGEMAIDTDLITQGMLQVFLASAIANVVATTDTPSDNEVPTYDSSGGTIQWEAGGTGGGTGSINLPVQSAKLTGGFLTSWDSAQIDAGEGAWRLSYDSDNTNVALWQFRMPTDYSSAPISKIGFTMLTATSGKVDYEVYVMAVSSGDSQNIVSASFDAANEIVAGTTVPGTAGFYKEISMTLSQDDSMTAGDLVFIRLHRDHDDADDTAVEASEVLYHQIEYTQ